MFLTMNPKYRQSYIQQSNINKDLDVTSVLDLHFRKKAAETEITLASKEAQVLCDSTIGSINYLRNIEFTSNKTEIGLRALVYDKVATLEILYDTYRTLFHGMSVATQNISNRISPNEQPDNNSESFIDVLEYVDFDNDEDD